MSQLAIVGSAFCQKRNKPPKVCQKLVNFCQSGEISPNLVTLVLFQRGKKLGKSICFVTKKEIIFVCDCRGEKKDFYLS